MTFGLYKNEIKSIIKENIKKNPDIFYYLNDDYVEELSNLLIEGIADAIVQNNKKIKESLSR